MRTHPAPNPPERSGAGSHEVRADTAPAFDGRWQELQRELAGFAATRVGLAAAEDIAQDAVLKLMQRTDELRDGEHARRWLFRVTKNATIDELRRRQRLAAGQSAASGSHLESDVEDEGGLDASLNVVVGRWLQEQIDALPEPYRTALRQVDVEGRSQADLARELRLSNSTARTRVQRARRKLAEHLRRSCAVEWDRRGNVLGCTPRGRCCAPSDPPPDGRPSPTAATALDPSD